MTMKCVKQITKQNIPPMDTGDVPAFLRDFSESSDPDNPITAGLFRLEKGKPLTYTYTYSEMKLVVDGDFELEDETGQKVSVTVGDLIYIDKGSTITFSTSDFGVGFLVGQRAEGTA